VSDILSQGGDRGPRPWRRWVAAIAVLALATVLIVEHFPRHPHDGTRLRSAPASHSPVTGVPYGVGPSGPGGVSGLAMSRTRGLRLPVTGPQPAWLWPATGHEQPIGGLPRHQPGYQFTRVLGGWAVQANPGGHVRCGTCAGPRVPVYFLADAAPSASRVGDADEVAAGASAQALWLTSFPPGSDMSTTAGTAQQVSITGGPAGSPLRLPAGYVVDQATDRGLLLAPMAQLGTSAYRLWNPAGSRASRSFGRVMAATAHQVAWATRCDPRCRVQVLDLATGQHTAITLPAGNSAVNGAFSPDGKFLALQVSYGSRSDDGALAMELDVAPAASSRPAVVPGIQVSSDALVSFGWPAHGDDLVTELSFLARVQVASWHPGARHLAVAVLNLGPRFGSLILH
jgi:hypothetical protein